MNNLLEEMNHHPLITVFIFALVIGGQLGDSESTGIDRYHWEISHRRPDLHYCSGDAPATQEHSGNILLAPNYVFWT